MDVVVTVPKSFGLKRWIGEGDPADGTIAVRFVKEENLRDQ